MESKVLYWVDESRKYGDTFFNYPTFDKEKAIRDAWIRWDGLTKSEQRRASVCVDFCEYSGEEEDPEAAFSELEESVFFPDYDCINISVDNWESVVSLMDDEIREAVHSDLAPCYPAAFLAEYEKRHLEKYGEPFRY